MTVRPIVSHHVPGVPERVAVAAVGEPGRDGVTNRYVISDAGAVAPPGALTFALPEPAFPPIVLDFQAGTVPDNGLNGVSGEAVMAAVLAGLEDRYAALDASLPCPENRETIAHLKAAALHLRDAVSAQSARTLDRVRRGVEGTVQP